MNQTFMKEKAILPLVLSMSLPMVLSMLVNSLYNIIDSYFVAQIDERAMTALSLVYPIQILITSVSVGCGIGINAVAAFFLGAGKSDKANDTVSVGVLLSVVHGIILTVGCIVGIPYFLRLFTQDAVVLSYGITYSNIVFAFSVIITIGVAFEKIFQAEGKMTVSMISMLLGCVVNIILDPILIFGLGRLPAMGISGAAWATGIGQTVSLVIYLAIYFCRPSALKIHFRKEMFQGGLCKRIYMVAIPAGLNLALPSLLITVLNGILATFGQTYVLVIGIYFKLQTFIYLTTNGIIQGIRPLVGYNYGAGEIKRVHKIFTTSLTLAALVMTVGTLLCQTISGPLIGIFTSNPQTIEIGSTALQIISFGFIISAFSVTVCGTLEGLGKGFPSLVISLLRYTLVIIPTAFILSRLIGPTGVWHAFWISELVTAIVSFGIYKKKV